MHEQIARVLYYMEVHLFFASLVCLAALLFTSSQYASATAKYWIWFATTLNFIVPVGAAIDRLSAGQLTWATPIGFLGGIGAELARSYAAVIVVCSVWLVGAGAMMVRLARRIRAERTVPRSTGHAAAGKIGRVAACTRSVPQGVPVRYAGHQSGPAVEGLVRPCILLPDGIERLLNERELSAVLLHEVAHAKRRDNLIRLIYELVRCLLWFHPLVWLAGSRLALFRELSCDEPVIRAARGADLISALAKLATPIEQPLLRAPASAFVGDRVRRLVLAPASQPAAGTTVLLAVAFYAVLACGVAETISHTACCFVSRL